MTTPTTPATMTAAQIPPEIAMTQPPPAEPTSQEPFYAPARPAADRQDPRNLLLRTLDFHRSPRAGPRSRVLGRGLCLGKRNHLSLGFGDEQGARYVGPGHLLCRACGTQSEPVAPSLARRSGHPEPAGGAIDVDGRARGDKQVPPLVAAAPALRWTQEFYLRHGRVRRPCLRREVPGGSWL